MIRRFFMVFAIIMAVVCFAQAAEAAKALNIQETTVALTGNPGSTVQGSFVLQNIGTENLNVVFTSTVLSDGTISFNGPTIGAVTGLAPGNVETVNFDVVIPTNQYAGTYTATLNGSDATVEDTAVLEVLVNEVPAITVDPTAITATITQDNSEDKTITITNTGNSDLANVVISFSDLSKGTDVIDSSAIVLDENGFALDFGANNVVTATITVPASQVAGTYTGTFDVVAGSLTQQGTVEVVVVEPIGHLTVPTEIIQERAVRTRTYNKVFTILNDGDFDLAEITITSTAAEKYAVTFTSVDTELTIGDSDQISVSFEIPEDEQSGEHTIGDIEIKSDMYDASFPLKIVPEVMLSLKDLKIYVDGDRESVDEDGGDSVKIKPESEIEVRATVENLFSDDDNIEIEGVFMTVLVSDIDDDDDIEEESDEVDIKEDDKEDISVFFDIPLEVDDGTFDVTITIEGEDENGVDHEISIDMEFEVDKESHEVIIREFSLARETLQCDRRAEFDVEIVNIGTKNEDEVVYTIECNNLDIDITEGGSGRYIELDEDPFDEDSKFAKTHTVTIPDTERAGIYTCELSVYLDKDDFETSEVVSLNLQACGTEEEEEEDDDPIVIVPPTVVPTVPPGPVVASEDDETSLFGLNQWLVLGILVAIFFIALIVVIMLALR